MINAYINTGPYLLEGMVEFSFSLNPNIFTDVREILALRGSKRKRPDITLGTSIARILFPAFLVWTRPA